MAPLAAVVFLAGCTQPQAAGPGGGASSADAVEPDASGSADPGPTPSPTPSPLGGLLGTSVTLSDGVVLTVYTYDKMSATDAPPPDQGGYWSAADVEVCAGSGADAPADQRGITVTRDPWSVLLGNVKLGSVVEPSTADYPQFPQPQFPRSARTLTWGHCVRGWMMFANAGTTHGADAWTPAVQYKPGPEDAGDGQAVYWPDGDA